MPLILARTAYQGTDLGHVTARTDDHATFHIVIDALGIAVGRVARSLANILDEGVQTNRQLIVITPQAAIE